MKRNKDLKAFHKIILDIGPCPLELLIDKFRKYYVRYIGKLFSEKCIDVQK